MSTDNGTPKIVSFYDDTRDRKLIGEYDLNKKKMLIKHTKI